MLSDLHNMQLIHKYIVLALEYFMPTEEHTQEQCHRILHVCILLPHPGQQSQ